MAPTAGKPSKTPTTATRTDSARPAAAAAGSTSGIVRCAIDREAYVGQKETDPLRPRADRRDRERCRKRDYERATTEAVATFKELLLLRGLLLGRLLGGLLLRW